MKRFFSYKFVGSCAIMAVLVLSLFSTVASAQVLQSAQNSTPSTDPVLNNLNRSPTDLSAIEKEAEKVRQSQPGITNTSANKSSATVGTPKAAGGKGDKDTGFAWRMLNPYYFIPAGLRILGNITLMFFGWILGLVGLVFNFIIDKTIVNLKTTIDSLGVITDVWKVIRDFINLFFIFALLYAAVGTVLGLEKVEWKKTVSNLVLAALLINFSLFMTKVALDVSNIITIGFYSQLPGVGAVGSGAVNPLVNKSNAGGISNSIMQSLKLETIFKPQAAGADMLADTENSLTTTFGYLVATLMGSIFICVTIVVMIAACWLFLKRFIDIIFLMIRSPIAFAGYVLPQLKSYQDSWWKELFINLQFPPVYMALMWITFKILQSPGFQTVAPAVDGYVSLFTNLGATTVQIVFRFIIVIAMMVYALKSAGKIGVEGGEIFTKYLEKKKGQLQGAIGRNTLGRAAAAIGDKNSMTGQALRRLESVPIIGAATSGAIRSGLKDVSGNSWGGAKGGFDQSVKDEAKRAKEGYERVGEKAEYKTFRDAPKVVVKKDGEDDVSFAKRTEEYNKEKKKWDDDKVGYDADKEKFDAKEKDAAAERQAKFQDNYKTTPFAMGGRSSTAPVFAENRAALKAIQEKVDADKKKEEKNKDLDADWEKALLAMIKNVGTEMTAALDIARSPEGSKPVDPADVDAKALRDLQLTLSRNFAAEITGITAISDKKEKAKKLREVRKAYKEALEKIEDHEVGILEEIEAQLQQGVSQATAFSLNKEKIRMKKSQRARNELKKEIRALEEKLEKRDEKESDKREREERESKAGAGGGGGEEKPKEPKEKK